MTKTPVKLDWHIPFDRIRDFKMTEIKMQNKVTKNNLRIISKPHAHFQTIIKTPVKCDKDRHKTVGGVAHTRYPLSMHFDSIRA